MAKIKNCLVKNDFSIEKYDEIVKEIRDIKVKKQSDYGTFMWDLLGIKGVFANILNKTLRLHNLVWKNKDVKYESARDTLLDLANYSLIGVMELDRREKRK